jgi:hypothetical protein
MLEKRLLSIAVATTLFAASSAEAVVLCAKPSANGTFNTSVKIREACKPNETQLDPADIGAQGPQGPVGPSEAWTAQTGGAHPLGAGDHQLIGSLDVPPGEYVVHTTLRVIADPSPTQNGINCELIASPGSEIDVHGWSPPIPDVFQQYDITMLGWARMPAGGQFRIECDIFYANPSDPNIGYNPSPIVATRVGAVLPLPPPPGD